MKKTAFDYKKSSLLKLFIQHYKGHMGLFLLDMACALTVAGVDLLFPYISKKCMEQYLPEGRFKTFFIVMGVVVAAYIVRSVLYYIITFWGHWMGAHMETDMRSELFEHIEGMSFSFFDKNRTGSLMSHVTTDLFEITELAHHGPEDLLISAITIIGSFCILCTIEWKLAVIVFAAVPIFVIFTVMRKKVMSAASVKVKAKMAVINSSIESGFSGIRTAKAFAMEQEEIRKFESTNREYAHSKKGYYQSMAVFHGFMEFVLSLIAVLVILAGGFFIMKGTINYIGLITFSLYVSTFITPVRKLTALVEQYVAGMAGFKRFVEIMRTDPEIADAPDAEVLEDVKGNISFENVSFSYGEGEDDPELRKEEVLRNISLEIPAGTCFAVVGPSGGGKTTLCHLIPRFYDVSDGCIKVDGKDIRQVTQHSLRRSIGIVQQDVFMFAGTIYDNIAYGKAGASREEIIDAAKRAEIHDEIMKMPEGYDTYIGERGVMLSGGQKQRIGIARVFLKNPPVIILDEATSALDSVTESRIQSAFDELAKGRTSIIIAHRLSTIRNADRIAVIDNNCLMETGSHEELMALGGEYSELVKAQQICG
ncbi:MAG: ABC transporter ATP-binding protein [Parasporobacterium sp.]|nr:ABC transporter ATP-binding protein [Parasporobacterium sp.]